MARIKDALSTRKRRNKVLKLAKGYYGSKSRLFKTAKQAVMKSGNYAYVGRKQRKRDFRKLWITRISAACKLNGMNYSTFINGLKRLTSILIERCSPRSLFLTPQLSQLLPRRQRQLYNKLFNLIIKKLREYKRYSLILMS